ncbi:type 1 glutamine amidotransferase [Desulfoluna spongiiphila]|uniref:GMP synthase-Glutamine amidotransferase n=1 Tax=Desulfoluna spongiiphila TaxID=419481 RepID=A0A1G5CQ32_9BACT|nr:type 1 glutamine amidotransferase [Desulfoluna spongiiphila]SCY04553.1 GMP synthase-Glutamine amidotransferase [Desulfoluna spongiiphila]
MRVHHLQHVTFEGLGSMEAVLTEDGHSLTATHLYRGEVLPDPSVFDLLIVMGGPMGVADENAYPWLAPEKRFIKAAVAREKKILGICLGAQLLAEALGAEVTRNPHREIGWFPVTRDPALSDTRLGEVFPQQAEVFHWHGDTFGIPEGAIPVGSSEACKNQGFFMDDRILALQFHLETTPDSATQLIENGRHELEELPFVQKEAEMLDHPHRFDAINRIMGGVLRALGA